MAIPMQSNYNAIFAKGVPGQIANEEKYNAVSRTVESAAGIAFGQPAFRGAGDHGVVAGGTFAATASGVAAAGNTGNGTMGTVTVTAGAMQGTYTLTVTEPATNAGEFVVTDPSGAFVGKGDVGSAFSAGGLAFTLADGSTDFNGGDVFTIPVVYTANAAFMGLAVKTFAPEGVQNGGTLLADGYSQYTTGGFMHEGSMYVLAGASVADGDPVYWNPATSRYTNTTTHIRIPGARFDTTGVNGDIVEVSIGNRRV